MNATQWAATLALPVHPRRDHLRGPASARVTLVEYGDYECPHCQAAHPIVKAIEAQLQDRLCFAYRHFPLATIHPAAQPAAEVAEAAGTQNRFWQMHDTLLGSSGPLTPSLFATAAMALGLDLPAFTEEVMRHVHLPHVREDFLSGVRSGVSGTPTFYINSVRHDDRWDFATLFGAVKRAIGAGPLPLAGR